MPLGAGLGARKTGHHLQPVGPLATAENTSTLAVSLSVWFFLPTSDLTRPILTARHDTELGQIPS